MRLNLFYFLLLSRLSGEMYPHLACFSSFEDPGPHGNGRYSQHMLPEVEKKDFRKGSQVCVLQNVYIRS